MESSPVKRCSTCGEQRPLAAFNRATKSHDGYAPACRRCVNQARRARSGPAQSNALRAAIKQGDLKEFRQFFAAVNAAPEKLLAIAIQNYNTAAKHAGHEQIVEFLLAQGARPHWSMLFEPARAGSRAIVDRLIAGGAEMNLFACAVSGDVDSAERLLHGDPSLACAKTPEQTRGYQDFTPLHCCCLSALGREWPDKRQALLEIGRLLLARGADVNAEATFYQSLTVRPLDMAAHSGGNLELSALLIANGASISSFALGEALAHRGRSVAEGFALAELFLQSGFAIDTARDEGTTLHRAANMGAAPAVAWLVQHGASVHARGRMGRTPLHMAAARNRSGRVAQILLDNGASLNERDDEGRTPLEVARHHGNRVMAEWLANHSD